MALRKPGHRQSYFQPQPLGVTSRASGFEAGLPSCSPDVRRDACVPILFCLRRSAHAGQFVKRRAAAVLGWKVSRPHQGLATMPPRERVVADCSRWILLPPFSIHSGANALVHENARVLHGKQPSSLTGEERPGRVTLGDATRSAIVAP